MELKLIITIGILCAAAHISQCSKILCIYPSPSKSHLLITQTITKALALKGHDVTVVSAFPLKNAPANYRDVILPLDSKTHELIANMLTSRETGGKLAFLQHFPQFINKTIDLADASLHLPEFQKIMNEESFDLVIVGIFMNNFLIGLGAHFRCPVIVLSVAREQTPINEFMGNQAPRSYIPHALMEATGQLNFKQRLINMGITLVESVMLTYFESKLQIAYNANFPPPTYPSYAEMKKNVSLALVNYHFSQGLVRPLVPGIIEIGGIQAKQTPDALPDDIEKWISSAKQGAIFFSLGSNIQSKDLPHGKRDDILKSFGKLKQHIVWKFEDENLPGLPKNVKIWKWLPQDDILAHPNIKLFITHGGAGSVAEAKFHGVPIIGIPIFADQPANVASVEIEGWGIGIEYTNLTEVTLSTAIHEILSNSSYTTTVKTASQIYRDRPMTSLDTAIFWVEYVLRHRGAKHMQANSVHLNFWQLHSLDVLAVLLSVTLMILLINFLILRAAFRCVINKFIVKKSKTD